jgi:hypothetical protein
MLPAGSGMGTVMALLMVVPIRDRGDSVLIVTDLSGATFTGFVASSSLENYFSRNLSMCECVGVVESHLAALEKILFIKSKHENRTGQMTPCVEITVDDLVGVFERERHLSSAPDGVQRICH